MEPPVDPQGAGTVDGEGQGLLRSQRLDSVGQLAWMLPVCAWIPALLVPGCGVSGTCISP